MVKFTKKKEYDAPMVEQLQTRVEKGFAGSGTLGSPVGDELQDNGPVINGDAVFN